MLQQPIMMRRLLRLVLLLLVAASANAQWYRNVANNVANAVSNPVETVTNAVTNAVPKAAGDIINQAKAAAADPSGFIRKTIMETTPVGIMAAELGKVRCIVPGCKSGLLRTTILLLSIRRR